MNPLVSIIIPTYNRKNQLIKAVRSCFQQELQNIEIIISDDGSNDNTFQHLQEHYHEHLIQSDEIEAKEKKHPYIRYYYNENRGASAARDFALQKCNGMYVKFMDSDDELIENTLHKEVDILQNNTANVALTGYIKRIYKNGAEIVPLRKKIPAPILNEPIDDMLEGQSLWVSNALYERGKIKDFMWDIGIPVLADWLWAWTVCLSGARYISLDIYSAYYNIHDGEAITNSVDWHYRASLSREKILKYVEANLKTRGELNQRRAEALAQYYYRNRIPYAEHEPRRWKQLWQYCKCLAPGFKPVEDNRLALPFVRALGPVYGILVFARVRKLIKRLGLSRPAFLR